MILDYLERHAQGVATFPHQADLRYRKAAQLAQKYQSDWHRNSHIAGLAVQLLDQTYALHGYGRFERDMLEFAAILHDIGQLISFRKYHKNSRFIINCTDPRGFTDEEVLLIGHVVRYHCKAAPTKKHKKFKRLSKAHRQRVKTLSGILRIAVCLDKTKHQRVDTLTCHLTDKALEIQVSGQDNNLDLEIWAARQNSQVLATALKRPIEIQPLKSSFST
ncbi:MAG: hypothetical protein AAF773_02310 [Cyanobacteria bacterium P01_D01_bin.115]